MPLTSHLAPSPGDSLPVDVLDAAPVSLWLEDFSRLRRLYDRWRAEGVTDLRAHLAADVARIGQCSACIRVVRVNRRTLALYGAADRKHLVANLHRVMPEEAWERYVDELVHLWEGRLSFSTQTVNHTLRGERIDIALNVQVLPGHEADWRQVLVSVEDLTAGLKVQQAVGQSEAYARGLFEHSPASLWVEDYSEVKRLLDAVRDAGVVDFAAHLRAHPDFLQRCSRSIRVVDVNRRTLDMFGARDRQSLFEKLPSILGGPMQSQFAEHLVDMWNGETVQQREVVHSSMSGEPMDVHMHLAVLPGHAHDWGLVLVSLLDVTARRRAEAELEYLGTHDAMTGLRNRSFFAVQMQQLEREGPWPATLMVFDLNGLKPVNDQLGHAAGDQLIRRAGDVLGAALATSMGAPGRPAGHAARTGGDEFVLLLPASDAEGARAVLEAVLAEVELDNARGDGMPLSFSIGCATLEEGGSADAALQLADERMYAHKRAHYEDRGADRRGA